MQHNLQPRASLYVGQILNDSSSCRWAARDSSQERAVAPADPVAWMAWDGCYLISSTLTQLIVAGEKSGRALSPITLQLTTGCNSGMLRVDSPKPWRDMLVQTKQGTLNILDHENCSRVQNGLPKLSDFFVRLI